MTRISYQGEKRRKAYFEGWYYKISNEHHALAFIAGIVKNHQDEHAFVQIMDTLYHKEIYLRYSINLFSFENDPFCIRIGNHFFKEHEIYISDEKEQIYGKFQLGKFTELNTGFLHAGIMGPFSFLPFLPCYHEVISLKHSVEGYLNYKDKNIKFDHAIGYLEKDYGTSFPSAYLWIQSNHSIKNTSVFLSLASIDIIKPFTGIIGIIHLKDRQIRISTYDFAKVKEIKYHEHHIYLVVVQKSLKLVMDIYSYYEFDLKAPYLGQMMTNVKESLQGVCNLHLYEHERLILSDTYTMCGIEIQNVLKIK